MLLPDSIKIVHDADFDGSMLKRRMSVTNMRNMPTLGNIRNMRTASIALICQRGFQSLMIYRPFFSYIPCIYRSCTTFPLEESRGSLGLCGLVG